MNNLLINYHLKHMLLTKSGIIRSEDHVIAPLDVPKIGICYDFQLKNQIPAEPFDRKMDLIITEKEIL